MTTDQPREDAIAAREVPDTDGWWQVVEHGEVLALCGEAEAIRIVAALTPATPAPLDADEERLRDWWDSLSELDQFNAYRIEKSNADALASEDRP
jgi:hypothetical protein